MLLEIIWTIWLAWASVLMKSVVLGQVKAKQKHLKFKFK